MFNKLKRLICKLFNFFAGNIFLLSILTVIISFIASGNYFYKALPIVIAVTVYFVAKKKIINFLSAISFALLFCILRFLTPIFVNLIGSLFIINKLISFIIFDFILAFLGFYILNIILFIAYELITKGKVEFPKIRIEY